MKTTVEKLKDDIRKTLSRLYNPEEIEYVIKKMEEDLNGDGFKEGPINKIYVPDSILNLWEELSEESKLIVYIMESIAISKDLVLDKEKIPKKNKPISIH